MSDRLQKAILSRAVKDSILASVWCKKSHMMDGNNCRCYPFQLKDIFLSPIANVGNNMSILRTCRLLYRESRKIAYKNPVFSFLEPENHFLTFPTRFFNMIGSDASAHIQHVSLSLGSIKAWGPTKDAKPEYIDFTTWAHPSGAEGHKLDVKGEFLDFERWLVAKARGGHRLRTLYLNLRTEPHSTDRWFGTGGFLWARRIVSLNQRIRRVDEICVTFEFKHIPPPDFLDKLALQIPAWKDKEPIHHFTEGWMIGMCTWFHDHVLFGTKPWFVQIERPNVFSYLQP